MNKLIAIVGPTASGKSDLAMQIAEQYRGEIICADSRTVYKGMDIGTAKPTKVDQARVPHHLLDVAEPNEPFSVAEFKKMAGAAIDQIQAGSNLPLLVGGSGLYIDSVLYNYQFPPEAAKKLRHKLDFTSTEDLVKMLEEWDPEAAAEVDLKNRRRVMRAIEVAGQPKSKAELRPNTLIIGLKVDRDELAKRIEQRVDQMIEAGFMEEVERIGHKYGWNSEAMTGIGYREFKEVILGNQTEELARDGFIRGDLYLAKKQMTWFKRNPDIKWVENFDQGMDLAKEFLA